MTTTKSKNRELLIDGHFLDRLEERSGFTIGEVISHMREPDKKEFQQFIDNTAAFNNKSAEFIINDISARRATLLVYKNLAIISYKSKNRHKLKTCWTFKPVQKEKVRASRFDRFLSIGTVALLALSFLATLLT